MEKRDIFIGGAWPYANYYLHVGHLAALLPGDILAKYFRGKGDNVIYVSGSDCHGTPITERAKKDGVSPLEIATYYHNEFLKTFDKLGFEYDKYSNTMSEHHKKYVELQFKKILENGYIYEKEELQDFCESCSSFLSDREIEGKCPHCGGKSTGDQCDVCGDSLDSSEVLDKHCKTCGSETVMKPNKHLYFRLTAFEKDLQELINQNRDKWRKNALGEAQKYIDMGLVDRAATRQLDWGVEVPVEGYDDKRIYVWIEAVLGYLSVGQEVAENRGIDFDEFMSKNNPKLKTYYVHGKDNIPFHTTIYPAIILAIKNNYSLPNYIVSSAYVNLNNEKMSKSKGNVINPDDIINEYGADTLRVYEMFMGDYKEDVPWSVESLRGCKRFIDKVIRLKDILNDNDGYTKNLEKCQHQTIKKVTYDLDNMAYNTAVSALMILTNAYQSEKSITKADYHLLLTLLNPIAPHITEQLNELIGYPVLANSSWPEYDEEKIKEDTVTIAVQVNGKVRGKLSSRFDIDKEKLLQMAMEIDNVKTFVSGKEIIKTIVIPGKIVNIVVKG